MNSTVPLPEPDCRGVHFDGYSSDQMHAYAAAVSAALRDDNTALQNDVIAPLRERERVRVRVLEDAHAASVAAARVALEAAAQYLEGVHETRLSKFADHIRKIEVSHD